MLSPWFNRVCLLITIINAAASAYEGAGTKCLVLGIHVGASNYCYHLKSFIPSEYCKLEDKYTYMRNGHIPQKGQGRDQEEMII